MLEKRKKYAIIQKIQKGSQYGTKVILFDGTFDGFGEGIIQYKCFALEHYGLPVLQANCAAS